MSLILQGSTSGSVTLQEPAVAGTTVLTLPATSGNVVVDSATQTLTNKTIEGGTVISGTAVSASSTSVDFTSIPSWVKRITVMFRGVSTNGTSNPLFQLGAGSVQTSGYLCASGVISTGNITNAANYTTGFGLVAGDASNVIHGSCTFSLMGSNIWVWSMTMGASNTTNPFYGGGSVSLSGTLDRIRITTVNGTDTFDAGTINILYE